jgi:hypothetical protein
MRFLSSRHLTRIFGTGKNALDFRDIMDRGKVLLVNLQPSAYLSDEQARLIGTLVLNELYETALSRPSGAKPLYCYVDEAAKFVTPELAQASEQCRQKGLHLTLAFQHLAQFKEEGQRVYKAFKHIRNKLVFAIPEREDALELADDVFTGLAEPEIKIMRRRLSHLIQDVRETSTSRTVGKSKTQGRSQMLSRSRSETASYGHAVSYGRTSSTEAGGGHTHTSSQGESSETGESESRGHAEHESHASGYSSTTSKQQNSGYSASKTKRQLEGGLLLSSSDHHLVTKGESRSESSASSRTDTGSDSYSRGESYNYSSSRSSSLNRSTAESLSTQSSQSRGRSRTWNQEMTRSQGRSYAISDGQSIERGLNESRSVTDQPGTRHTPFWEEEPEHWTLEEQRWRASELLMSQPTGQWFARTARVAGFGRTNLPDAFYITPERMLRLSRDFYAHHNLAPDTADALILDRSERLRRALPSSSQDSTKPEQQYREKVWNRVALSPGTPSPLNEAPAQHRKRGPKPDLANHAKVAAIVSSYGESWTDEDNLLEICEDLDKQHVPIPKTWPTRKPPARSWRRALQNDPGLVIKTINDRCKGAQLAEPEGNLRQLPLDL